MQTLLARLFFLLTITSVYSLALAVEVGAPAFQLRFDSTQSVKGDNPVSSRVVANFQLDPIEGELNRYSGQGRLRYTELQGLLATATDGVLNVIDLKVSLEDGTVVIGLFPGEPKPVEWVILTPITAIKQFQWFSGFGLFHNNELGDGGFKIENWQYPEGDVYARKTYSREMVFEGVNYVESTTIELTPVPDFPRIDAINTSSAGTSVNDPETGEDLELSATLHVPLLYAVERCTWTGNNFTGPGIGDPDDSCRWTYKPKEGKGPKRDTYGPKDLKLTVIFRHGVHSSAETVSSSLDYKVFFTKKGDDDSDADPNWFDYWGDDGAVPGLDDSTVDYNASLAADTIAEADGTKVIFGPNGAGSDGQIIIAATDICSGGTFPGGEGIDLTALTLSHERKHNELDALGGTDSDGDDVPDSAESGTSTTNPDSCDLANNIHKDYATYGDHEFIARQAELGVSGVAKNDWAVPGRQASMQTAAAGGVTTSRSGVVHSSRLATAMYSSQGAVQAVSPAASGLLTGVYSAVGQDPDGTGLFASMRLDVGLSIVERDYYSVIAWLADDQGTEVSWARAEADLSAGSTTLQLIFDGPGLNQAGVSPPFVVSRVELYYRVGKHSVLADSALNALTTQFNSLSFKPLAAKLAGVSSELPVDSEFDGLINQLDITVDLDTSEAGEYEVSAQLRGAKLALYDSQTIVVGDGVGSAQVTLVFDGSSIFFNREDGPFQVTSLQVKAVSSGSRLDFQASAWTTAAYPFNAFQSSGVVIDETSYSDSGGELDANGKFLTLDLSFAISSMVSGPYSLNASLEDVQGRTIARATAAIGLGGVEGVMEMTPVMLSFDAQDIFAAGIDGPYQLADVTIISDDGKVMDQNPMPWMTAAYTADDFGLLPVTEEIFLDGFE